VESKPTVNSHNEWDTLEEIIVGRLEGAARPPLDPGLQRDCNPNSWDELRERAAEPMSVDELSPAMRQLEELCHVLEGEGVTVRRPDILDHSVRYTTPDFSSSGLDAVMPRDVLTVIGDEIIEAPMAWRCRYFEFRAYRSLIREYFRRGARWTTAPKPLMTDELYDLEYQQLPGAQQDRLTLEQQRYVTTEFEPCFDAADITRCGRDIFVQRSQVTNRFGIEWLRRHLGPRYRVHTLTFEDPNPMHIDATLTLLRPGLAMVNPKRPCRDRELFARAGWETVEAEPSTVPPEFNFFQGSHWLSMNFIMLDPERVLIESEEVPMQKLMRKLGFSVITTPLREVYPYGGSFHCVTCDIRRDGAFEDYGFPEPREEFE
jgi:glycine amidinotransferase